jgi:hypothetical protein
VFSTGEVRGGGPHARVTDRAVPHDFFSPRENSKSCVRDRGAVSIRSTRPFVLARKLVIFYFEVCVNRGSHHNILLACAMGATAYM